MNKRRVLVVDDSQDSAHLLEIMIDMAGHEVRVAWDGQSALALAATFHPEVAVLDIGLPDIDGYELAERLRALPGLAGMSLIAITGFSEESDRARARHAGFDHFVVKPFDPDEITRLISA